MDKQTEKNERNKQFPTHDETKNIPKNFLKAIFNFTLGHTTYVKRLFIRKRLELPNSCVNSFFEFV